MTARERYAKCKSMQELNNAYNFDKMSADTFEFMNACEHAYKERYSELLKAKESEQYV